MDEELRHHLDAMEERLIGRLNSQTERVLDRLTTLEADIRNQRSEHTATRELVTALPATVLRAAEQPLLKR
ncbi:MAG TPA: hypothetical protein VKI44_07765 [Acetobacteraceae bacterium]|nr:hypothetical protein [Acetobacteraceae bacterium]